LIIQVFEDPVKLNEKTPYSRVSGDPVYEYGIVCVPRFVCVAFVYVTVLPVGW